MTEPQSVNRLVVLQVILIVAIAILGAVGMLVPSVVPDVPEAGGPLALSSSRRPAPLRLPRRAGDQYLSSNLPPLRPPGRARSVVPRHRVVAALVLDYMQLGWWLGHGFELLGIALVGIPVAIDLSRHSPRARSRAASRRRAGPGRAGIPRRTRPRLTLRLAEKDAHIEGHTRRVALRAVLVGEELGLPPNRFRSARHRRCCTTSASSPSPTRSSRSRGPSTRTSSQSSSGIPSGATAPRRASGFSDLVRRLVLDHHERLDGTGLHGRTALDLDLETRILTVCDVYDALLSVRVYRGAWTHDKAIGLLREQTGSASTLAASQPSSACSHETHSSSAWQSRRLVLRLRASRRVRERDAEAFTPSG